MKRTASVLLATIVVGFAVLVAWMLTVPAPPSTAPAPSSTAPGTLGAPPRPDGAASFRVDYVYDGDTIRVDDGGETSRVRLIGIDTPEGTPTVECGAEEARDRLRELLPEGSRVWAAADAEDSDRYDRLLRNLWTDEGTFVNLALVESGHARTLTVPPNTRYADLLRAAERQAKVDGRGQWGGC